MAYSSHNYGSVKIILKKFTFVYNFDTNTVYHISNSSAMPLIFSQNITVQNHEQLRQKINYG